MKRSLKIHIFFHVLIIASLIVFVNRTIAQWLLLDQIKGLLRTDLVTSFVTCESEIDHVVDFHSCHRKINPGNILNSFADSYVLCPSSVQTPQTTMTARPQECDIGLRQSEFWANAKPLQKGSIEMASVSVNDQVWIGVRRIDGANVATAATAAATANRTGVAGAAGAPGAPEPDGTMLLVNESVALNMLNQMWSYRDRNLVFSLPVIVLMLMMLAIYLAYLLMRAISSLQVALTSLNANNLDSAQQVMAPYREFDQVLSVFEDLRQRLLESFAKTRRFAADASHELRTPLTILRGNSELMINELPAGSKIYDQVHKIHGEAERLIEITEKLLMLSRADANNIVIAAKDMNVSEFLEEMIEDGLESTQNLKISTDIQPGVHWLCDASLIAQLIHNLLANALKYNKADGWIHLELRQTTSSIKLKISNSAEFVPDDLNERAFERFYRGNFAHSRQADGQGLGLSIALEIAKVHKGKLSLQGGKGVVTVIFEAPC